MPIHKSFPSGSDSVFLASLPPRWADLPGLALVAILRQCDEPTREKASLVCKAFAEAVPLARRDDYEAAFKRPGRWTQEHLPTATELADRGCPKPHWGQILKTIPMPAAVTRGPLTHFYELAIGLTEARKNGYAAAWSIGSSRYVGGGADQTQEGFGVMTFASGDHYEGGWKAGERDGHGVNTFANGGRYEGGFKAGLPDGYGVYTFPNGDRSEGIWKAGNPMCQ